MTLLFMDGFDAKDVQRKWNNGFTNTPPFFTEGGRYGFGNTLQAGGVNSGNASKAFTPSAQVVVGCALRWMSGAKFGWMLKADGGSVRHLSLDITSGGALTVTRGSSPVIATSAAGVLVAGAWAYVEMKATVHDTTGFVECRVNGVQVLTFTGDTRNAGTSMNLDVIQLGAPSDNMDQGLSYDDLYILNSLGTRNNDYLGEVVVRALPVTGPGASTGFAPTPAVANWQNVDEVPPDIADFNAASVSGTRDTYAVSDLPFNPTGIFAVQANVLAAKTNSAAQSVKPVVRSGGTNYPDTAQVLSASPITLTSVRETDPATSAAWTFAGVNALEVGAEVA